MSIIYFGTPEYSATVLEILIKEGFNIRAVVTQIDKPKGRGKRIYAPPVKVIAQKYRIDVLQPLKLRGNRELYWKLYEYKPEFFVVFSYGLFLPPKFLKLPRYMPVNLHLSLLPKYRGAAPVNWAIINGEKVTGITTMKMTPKMDAGPILLQEKIEIRDDDTAVSLLNRMIEPGANLLIKTLKMIKEGKIKPIPQNEVEASYAPILRKELGLIDWDRSAKEIDRLIRGLQPWPQTYTFWKGKRLKIIKAHILYESVKEEPGTIIPPKGKNKDLLVATKDYYLILDVVQLEGGRAITGKELACGCRLQKGDKLGE